MTVVQPIAAILNDAAELFAIPRSELTSQRRFRMLCKPRAAVAAVAREQGRTFAVIGRYLGDRDHKTIMHACVQAEIWAEREPAFAERMAELRRRATERSAAA